MATTTQLLDEYAIETVLVDGSSAGADKAAEALDRLEAAAQTTAASVRDAGQATADTGGKLVVAATAFDKIAGRVDDVTRAHNQLTREEGALRATQEAVNREVQAGGTNFAQYERTLAAAAQRVSASAEKLGQLQAEAEANTLATQAWNGAVGQGASAIQAWSGQIAAGAQASRDVLIAQREATAAIAAFNGELAAGAPARAAANAIEALIGELVPGVAAARQFGDAQRTINGLFTAGQITGEQQAAALDKVTASYSKVANAGEAAAAAQRSAAANALQGQIDKYAPEIPAAREFAEEQKVINGLFDAGHLTAEQQSAALERVATAYRQAAAAGDTTAAAAAAAAKQAAAATAASKASGDALQGLIDKYAPLVAMERAQAQEQQEINALFASGNLTATQHAAALARSTTSYKQVAEGAGAAAAAQRGMAIQFIQGASGIATGQPILTTFIQQGHQVVDQSLAMGQGFGGITKAAGSLVGALFSPIGVIAAVAGAIGLATIAGNNHLAMLADLRSGLRATQENFGALADTADAVGQRVAATSGLTRDAATKAAAAIAGAKYFSGTSADLERLTRDAADLGKTLGGDAAKGASTVRDALDDTSRAAHALADQGFRTLTPEVVRAIDLMQAGGDRAKAFATWLAAVEGAAKGAAGDMAPLDKAWEGLTNAMSTTQTKGQTIGEWFANDLAKFIRDTTSEIEGLTRVWNAMISALSVVPTLGRNVAPGTAFGSTEIDGMPTGGYVPPAATVVVPSANAVATQIATILRTQYQASDGAIAGMLGNSFKESGFNPTSRVIDSNGLPSVGLFQHNGPRATALASYAGVSSGEQASVEQQVAFTMKEIFASPSLRAMWSQMQTQSPAEAATTFNREFERPKDLLKNAAAAVSAANQVAAPGGVVSTLPPVVSEGMVSETKAAGDAQAKLNAETRAYKAEQMQSELAGIGAQMGILAGTGQEGSKAYQGLQQRAQELTASLYKNVDAQTEANRASDSSLRANQGLTAAEVALNGALEQRRQLALSSGVPFTEADAAKVAADRTAEQVQALGRLNFSMANTAANSIQMARAYDEGNQSVVDATAKQAAYNQALTMFKPGSDAFRAAYKDLVVGYQQVAQAAAEAQVAQQNAATRDNLQYIQTETSTLGMNENARTKLLAVMKAEQDMHRKFGDVLPDEAKAYLALTAAQADATAAYANQKASLDELSGFFDNTFSTISTAITSAMATGEISMAKLGDVGKAVVSALEAEFLKLALLNPLKNAFFGNSSPTLDSVGGIVGNLFGSSSSVSTVASSAGSAIAGLLVSSGALAAGVKGGGPVQGPTQSGATLDTVASSSPSLSTTVGGVGTALKGADTLSGGKLLAGAKDYVFKAVGYTPGQSIGGWVSGLIGETTAAGVAAAGVGASAAVAATAATAAGVSAGGIASATTAASIVGAGQAVVGTVGTAINTITQALPYIGAAVSIVTDLVSGNYRGAAIVATTTAVGAIVGSIVPGIGTAIGAGIGATVGVLYDTFFPGHKKNPYQDTELDVVDGRLQRGKQVNQLEKLDLASAQVRNFADGLNKYMDVVGIKLSNANGVIAHVGNGIKGLTQIDDVGKAFKDLRFDTDPNAADASSNFGIARHAISDTSFADPDALNGALLKVAGFADAMDSLGFHLASVGKDLTSISIASVDLTDALGTGSDLRTALEHDLPGQLFANQDALNAEVDKVNQFVNGTMPGLLNPVLKTSSSFLDSLAAVQKQYYDAIYQASGYGLDIRPLQDAEGQAEQLLYAPARKQLDQADEGVRNAGIIAGTGSPDEKFRAQFRDSQIAAEQKRDALIASLKSVYGDAVTSTDFFFGQLSNFDATFAAQATASIVAYQRAQKTNGLTIAAAYSSIQARAAVLAGDQQKADLLNFDAKAAQEQDSYGNQLADAYGESFRTSKDYQNRLTELTRVQEGERLQIVQKYGAATSTAMADALKQAQTNVGALFTSLTAYADKLKVGSDSPLSATDQYALAASRFNAVSGAAAAGDYHSATELQGYSDTFLSASRAVNGSGAGYAADFGRVLDALSNVSAQTEALTISSQREIMQSQTDQLTASVTDLRDTLRAEITALRREVAQQNRIAQAA